MLTGSPGGGTDVLSSDITRSIDRLKSLHDSDRGFSDIVGYGARSIPFLRALLFSREPSGLHQARCRAADALATLHAYGTLEEFLQLNRVVDDPVERLGDETVISCAARGLARSQSEAAFRLLLDLVQRHMLTGVVAGLGSFRRREAIPYLVAALREDEVRITAEAALRQIGSATKAELIAAAQPQAFDPRGDSESGLRKRRSALGVLIDIGVSRKEWSKLRRLMTDPDMQISILACSLGLQVGTRSEKPFARSRLHALRSSANWLERLEIDQYLRKYEQGAEDNQLGRV